MPVSSLGRRNFLIGSKATRIPLLLRQRRLGLYKHRIYRILNFITNLLLCESVHYTSILCTGVAMRISSVMRCDG